MRWFQQRHFFAGVAIPIFFVFIMVLGGGFENLVIMFHEGRTTATFTKIDDSRGRVSSYYSYMVNGHTYTGRGLPDHRPFAPPFKVGDTFEIRYSKLVPFFSIAQNPTTIFGQFLVGSLFLLWADYMATRNRSFGK